MNTDPATAETPTTAPVGPWTPLPVYRAAPGDTDEDAIFGDDNADMSSFNFQSANGIVATVWFLRQTNQIRIGRNDMPGIAVVYLSVHSRDTIVNTNNPRAYTLDLGLAVDDEYLLSDIPDRHYFFHLLVGLCIGRVTLTTE